MDRECVPFWGDYHCHYGLGQSLFMTSNQMMKIQKYSEFIFKQTAEYSWLISSAAAKPLETCSANRRVHLTALSGYVWRKFCVFYTLLPPNCMASLRSLALFFTAHKHITETQINLRELNIVPHVELTDFMLCWFQWCYTGIGTFGFDIFGD